MAQSLKKRGAGKPKRNKRNVAKRLKQIQKNMEVLKSLKLDSKN